MKPSSYPFRRPGRGKVKDRQMETTDTANSFSQKGFSADLSGRVAIVTGAARGIGRAVADAIAHCGASVLGLDQAKFLSREATVRPWLSKTADISNPDAIFAALDFCIQKLGRPDILVHAAAISIPSRVSDMEPETWERSMDVNLHPVFYLSRALTPYMAEGGRGCMIFFSSMIASTGGETSAHYTAAKCGVEGFARSLAREIAPQGIRVNVIAPGMIDTAMLDLMPASQKEKLIRRIPMRRLGVPGDLVGIAIFLASDAAAYITGQTFHVNGGLFMS